METHKTWMAVALLAAVAGAATGCTRETVGGAAAGAAVTGGAYEYQNKQAMDELNAQRDRGEISQDEYDRRKSEIEGRSIVY